MQPELVSLVLAVQRDHAGLYCGTETQVDMTDIKPVLKKGRKFDQVLDAATRVFMAEGYEGASMDAIALEAQVSKATVYSYFPEKQILFVEAAKAEISRVRQQAEDFAHQEAPAEVVLRFAARAMIGFYTSKFGQSLFKLCVAEADRFPVLGQTMYEVGPKMGRERMAGYFEIATQHGLLNVDDPLLAADLFSGLCHANLHHRVAFGYADSITEADIDRIVEAAIEMFLTRYGVQA